MPFLDPKFKAEWVAALRSGKYHQGNGRLKARLTGEDFDRFCCLGVACDILNNIVEWGDDGVLWASDGGGFSVGTYWTAEYTGDVTGYHHSECAFLPEGVSREMGLWGHNLSEIEGVDLVKYGENPEYEGQPLDDQSIDSFLISMNDSFGKSLSDIADFIEEYL